MVGNIDKSWMKRAGHMIRMKDGRLPKRSVTKKQDCCRKQSTAKTGGLCEDRYEKGRGGRKVERKGQRQGAMEKKTMVAIP